jgi:enterochelin esterase-like enzyme
VATLKNGGGPPAASFFAWSADVSGIIALMKRNGNLLIGMWLAAAIALTACAGNVSARAEAAHVATNTPLPSATPLTPDSPSATATALPSASPSATLVPSPIPSSTPAVCLDTAGTVFTTTVPSKTLRYSIDAQIYLPPCYAFNAPAKRYPVLYLIHGLNFTEDQWVRLGVATAADKLIAEGAIAPLIVVMPRDRKDDRFNRAFVNDLVPYIDATYRTVAVREFRAIGGLSRGGGWAVHIGLEFPKFFSRIGLHSPAVFLGDDADLIRWTWHLPKDLPLKVYMDIGEGDSLVHSAAWLDQVLTYANIPHQYILQDGAHSEKYWAAHITDYLKFYAADWRFTPLPTSTPDPADEQAAP